MATEQQAKKAKQAVSRATLSDLRVARISVARDPRDPEGYGVEIGLAVPDPDFLRGLPTEVDGVPVWVAGAVERWEAQPVVAAKPAAKPAATTVAKTAAHRSAPKAAPEQKAAPAKRSPRKKPAAPDKGPRGTS